ncbi:hypothetical protein [Streptomyces sp. NPDC056049]|uniref:hypothetical protein n=1 Tax=Streptomyces sp. NPDC056049 TaxID=3345693 RepID=UPI0035E1F663
MRGSAAPTSPGAWDARSEALLGAPAVDAEPAPPAIAPGAARPLPALDLPADPPSATPDPVPGPSALDDLLSAFGPPRPTPHARVPEEERTAATDTDPEPVAPSPVGPGTGARTSPQADAEPQAEAERQADAETRTDAEPQADGRPAPETRREAEPGPEPWPEAEPQAEVRPEPESRPEAGSDPEPRPEGGPRPVAEAESVDAEAESADGTGRAPAPAPGPVPARAPAPAPAPVPVSAPEPTAAGPAVVTPTPVPPAPAGGGAVAPGPGAAWGEPPAPAAPPAASPAPATRARRAGDPVKVLMHRHRELCARAVDPLEIAAGLEAQGFTDRTAARYRHRDVFSLAEELYARVPRGHQEPAPPRDAPAPRTPWALAALAPGAAAALLVPALLHLDGAVRFAAATAGALGLAGALVLAVRRGPLRAAAPAPAARLWTLWLLAYAVAGDGLLEQVLAGGPDGAWNLHPTPLLGLALAVAPAAWCAHLFAGRARRRIADSRGLADFAAGTRAWLLAAVLLHLAALTALLALTGLTAGALALGLLFLLARLLTVHGHPETAAAALAAACAAEALGLASVLAARLPLPGFDALALPVRTAVDAWGAGALPALVCGAAALGLLAHATGVLTRASAHTTP